MRKLKGKNKKVDAQRRRLFKSVIRHTKAMHAASAALFRDIKRRG